MSSRVRVTVSVKGPGPPLDVLDSDVRLIFAGMNGSDILGDERGTRGGEVSETVVVRILDGMEDMVVSRTRAVLDCEKSSRVFAVPEGDNIGSSSFPFAASMTGEEGDNTRLAQAELEVTTISAWLFVGHLPGRLSQHPAGGHGSRAENVHGDNT